MITPRYDDEPVFINFDIADYDTGDVVSFSVQVRFDIDLWGQEIVQVWLPDRETFGNVIDDLVTEIREMFVGYFIEFK
jgi:hypothetical protein